MTDITIDDIAEYMYRGDKEIFDSCVERVKKEDITNNKPNLLQ